MQLGWNFFDATFQNKATFNRSRGKTQWLPLKHTNLIKSSTKTQLPCSFCLKLRIFLDFCVATNPTPAIPTFPKIPGQRPTEKRIFYAGSTMGPNRMVACHKESQLRNLPLLLQFYCVLQVFFPTKKTHTKNRKKSLWFFMVLFFNFFSVFFSSNVGCHLVKFFLGEICVTFMTVTEVSGPPMMPPPFGYQPMQLPQVWDVQMGVSNGSEFFFSVAWVGWGVGTWVGLRLRYSYYSWDFYFLCFFSWMNVDSSSCHGSGHDFMGRSLLRYFFAKQLHSTSSPERLKHLCKKAPTS